MRKMLSALVVVGVLAACGPKTPAQILNEAGYLELRPASKLHYPSSIVRVEREGRSDVVLFLTCTLTEEALRPYFLQSPSTDHELATKLSGTFSLGGGYKELIKAKVGGEVVRDVQVTFKNVQILDATTQQMIALLDSIDKSCWKAVEADLRTNLPVCQVRSIFRADLVYTVKFEDSVKAEAKAQITQAIAPELAANARNVGSDKIVGENLHYGVKLERRCITVPGGKIVKLDVLS
ncbi:MAG: hypothetical protein EXQ86_01870 [Rhodospirillales bacterium]|nr:hypothetical protein [Rhodospirillales bacterium]